MSTCIAAGVLTAIDIGFLYKDFHNGKIDGATFWKRSLIRTASTAAGVGGYVGGATLGVTIGSCFPFVGTIFGGVVGALIGGIITSTVMEGALEYAFIREIELHD